MKLISMTDFVLEQEKQFYGLKEMQYSETEHVFVRLCINYANFLKQPLTLGMFVPCQYNGSEYAPFKETDRPLDADLYNNVDNPITHRWKEYQEAKERVLFEGIEVKIHYGRAQQSKDIVTTIKKEGEYESFIDCINGQMQFDTIEDAIHLDLELTPTALKQIGLELETA